MQRQLAALTALLVTLLAAACNGAEPAPPSPAAPPPTPGPITVAQGARIVIGVSTALSGSQAAVGQDLANAVDLAVRDFGRPVKGREITVQREDDGCNDPEKATAVAERLAAAPGVAGVIGPMCTTGAQAANDVYEAAGIPHITPSATRNDLSDQGERFFFRTAWRDDAQSRTQARYARDGLVAGDVTVVDDGEPYGKTLADAFVPEFEAAGGSVLSRERITRGATDFSGLARQIVSQQPAAVVFEGFDPEGALVLRALREAGYTGAFIGPDSLLNVRDFVAAAGAASEGAIVTGGLTPDDAFIERFTAAYGRAPATPFVLQAYDATRVLLTAIESVAVEGDGGALTIEPARLAQALRTQSFAGLTGTLRFDEWGDRTDATAREAGLAIYRVTGGAFELIEEP
jgi:branched-chain amino acid transport system substrate-binding protein